MPLIKNEIPILEYDTNPKAVIMPGHSSDYIFTEKAVLLFMKDKPDAYAQENNCEITGIFESVTKIFNVYKTEYKGTIISLCQAPLGGAAAVQVMEQLIAGGVKKIIATGCCGSLLEDNEGDFFIPTAALRQEGTSYHYLPPSREVQLDSKAIEAIEKTLSERGLGYRKCKTWTTDGFYRETKEMVDYRKKEGYETVEMECASMAACARMRGVIFGQLLFTGDTLADTDNHNPRNWGNDTEPLALELAMDAVIKL